MLPVANAACDDWVLGPDVFELEQANGIHVMSYGWSGKSLITTPGGNPLPPSTPARRVGRTADHRQNQRPRYQLRRELERASRGRRVEHVHGRHSR
jgi:hypothetical protein